MCVSVNLVDVLAFESHLSWKSVEKKTGAVMHFCTEQRIKY